MALKNTKLLLRVKEAWVRVRGQEWRGQLRFQGAMRESARLWWCDGGWALSYRLSGAARACFVWFVLLWCNWITETFALVVNDNGKHPYPVAHFTDATMASYSSWFWEVQSVADTGNACSSSTECIQACVHYLWSLRGEFIKACTQNKYMVINQVDVMDLLANRLHVVIWPIVNRDCKKYTYSLQIVRFNSFTQVILRRYTL